MEWMKGYAPALTDLRLSEMSLPGTHDSGTAKMVSLEEVVVVCLGICGGDGGVNSDLTPAGTPQTLRSAFAPCCIPSPPATVSFPAWFHAPNAQPAGTLKKTKAIPGGWLIG